jgi:hypothetical protein
MPPQSSLSCSFFSIFFSVYVFSIDAHIGIWVHVFHDVSIHLYAILKEKFPSLRENLLCIPCLESFHAILLSLQRSERQVDSN